MVDDGAGTRVRCCNAVCTSPLSQSVRAEVRSPLSSPDFEFSPQIHLSLSCSYVARFTDMMHITSHCNQTCHSPLVSPSPCPTDAPHLPIERCPTSPTALLHTVHPYKVVSLTIPFQPLIILIVQT